MNALCTNPRFIYIYELNSFVLSDHENCRNDEGPVDLFTLSFVAYHHRNLSDLSPTVIVTLSSVPCCPSYKRVVTPRRAGTAVVVCWIVAIVVGLIPMLGWNNLQHLHDNGSQITPDLLVTCEFEKVISMDYMVYFNFFGWVLPPLVLMLLIYAEIFYMIHKQLNKKVKAHC